MKSDIYGQQILSESDLCDLYLRDPDRIINNALIESPINLDVGLNLTNIPKLNPYTPQICTVDDFDLKNQSNWHMPNEYKELDIAKWLLDQCKEDYELQRVGDELLKFQELEMFPMLQYCKYLVDTMRKNKIVWGVGRGSSVASYSLYLIGIHRINSLHYDLSIDEFLK